MFKNRAVFLFFLTLSVLSCSPAKHMKYNVTSKGVVEAKTVTMDQLELLLRDDNRLRPFLEQKDSLMIQVIYTRIDRDRNNNPYFQDFFYNVNPARYFYPASTVKMPTAMLALEKLNQLGIKGLDQDATMITGWEHGRQTGVYNDPTAREGKPSVGQYVKKIFLVSDNDAQNRLYEFLGQKYLNESLREKGYPEAEIIHRLQISLTEAENRRTNPVSFFDSSGIKIYDQPGAYNDKPYYSRKDLLGKGYMSDGRLVSGPFDFSARNRISLPSLHQVLKSIMFPLSVPAESRFQVDDSTLNMVRKYMSAYPGESDIPQYRTAEYYPSYCKFLLYGAEKNAMLIPGVRIFNKVGDAYGFLLDIAYVADFKNQVEFMLSAVIYCNKDGILNDDQYDYDAVGFPFLKYLGEAIYAHELSRSRANKPDLSEFRINY
jgi:Beta-lactamase enzyme family